MLRLEGAPDFEVDRDRLVPESDIDNEDLATRAVKAWRQGWATAACASRQDATGLVEYLSLIVTAYATPTVWNSIREAYISYDWPGDDRGCLSDEELVRDQNGVWLAVPKTKNNSYNSFNC